MATNSKTSSQISFLLNSLERILTKRVEICNSINIYDKNVSEIHYNNTIKLLKESIPLLAQLSKLTGFTDLRYQTIADKVSYTINICSCRYFNFSGDSDVYKNGLNLIEYGNAIAQSKYVKDLCEENLNICLSLFPKDDSAQDIQEK